MAVKRTSRHIESALQRAIVAFHSTVVTNPASAILFAVPNGEARDAVTAAILSGISAKNRAALPEGQQLRPFGQGVLPGVVDLILLTDNGGTDLIEVKRPEDGTGKGHTSKAQKLFHAAAVGLKHSVHVIDCLAAYEAILRSRDVHLRIASIFPARTAHLPDVLGGRRGKSRLSATVKNPPDAV